MSTFRRASEQPVRFRRFSQHASEDIFHDVPLHSARLACRGSSRRTPISSTCPENRVRHRTHEDVPSRQPHVNNCPRSHRASLVPMRALLLALRQVRWISGAEKNHPSRHGTEDYLRSKQRPRDRHSCEHAVVLWLVY
ncbi:hypothetical protein DL546_009926 [Coniochaeta pulveracea]|uniref:Uncharacterized protein n=1 Tax=Coniochaeta pulveracea TaxID=177199 RepID=A0A420Y2M5_9PEZI|nr:hypothetical protein DL546_009926 [Coniochaeta pulveracea]